MINKVRIAKNYNTYIIKQIPEGFWDDWRTNRTELKSKGFAPFKKDGIYYLAIYDGNTLSENEYAIQEQEYLEEIKSELESIILGTDSLYESEENEMLSIISCANSLDDLEHLDAYFANYKFVLKDIEDNLFRKMISE